jgi:hypothetical protein
MLEFLKESTLKCGGKRKFIVIKIDDLKKHINSVFKLAMLENDLNDIAAGRAAEGKEPCPEYLVINTDEPYAGEIIEIMKRNGHWGEPQEQNLQNMNYPECVKCICSKCNDTYCKTEACMETCIHYGKAYPSEHCQNEPQC